ncbi:hypothetical protein A2Y85_08050 [candidate division WOR-3 bacterium RBG_13_43_14]|uniref:Transposase IS200-like domain-containing protein n=1 Tax=candidate division WOR-3 bacterium RBG_13_43_14 TaxID=1802590 RepID=A0A1F4U1Q7_UNCW3|nr:MAG: hypothetical protein A2Y85_08050 [candidate division WOR-3 bacterium RBG_13_43_14]
MARPLRVAIAGGLYHVTAHGNGRLWLFRNDPNRLQFLKIVGASAFKYGVIIHAFVLMTNHLHLLVETPLANLSQFMRKSLSDYGLYYNCCYRRRGSVFKSRYGSSMIQQDRYYLTVVRYLYYNPVKARLVKRPEEYRWSSLYYLLNRQLGEAVNWFKVDKVLELLGGRQGLVELMAVAGEELPCVYRAFIGDKEWADSIIAEHRSCLDEEISQGKEMRRGLFNVTSVMRLVARVYGVASNDILTGKSPAARKVCVYLLSKYTPLAADEIGEIFRMNKWAVFKTVHRLSAQQREMKVVERLKKKMS